MINSKSILLIVKIWVLWSGLSVFTDPLFSAKGQKGRKWARNEHFWRNCSIPFMPFPWRGWVTCQGSDTASAPGAARLLRFQGELRAAAGNPRGGSVLFTHWECPRYCRGGLGGNIQARSAHQRSHQGLPSFWRCDLLPYPVIPVGVRGQNLIWRLSCLKIPYFLIIMVVPFLHELLICLLLVLQGEHLAHFRTGPYGFKTNAEF